MTAADLLAWWPQVVTGLGGLGSGGVISGYLTHKRATREQTDEVALSLVEQLRDELKAVRAEQARERELCDRYLHRHVECHGRPRIGLARRRPDPGLRQ